MSPAKIARPEDQVLRIQKSQGTRYIGTEYYARDADGL